MATHKPYLPFPPEHENALWEGVRIELKKAMKCHLLPYEMYEELHHEIYAHIKSHWQYEPTRAKVTTYIANCARWEIKAWRERQGENRIIYYGEDETTQYFESLTPPTYNYSIWDVIDQAGFTDIEKQIVEARLEGRTFAEIVQMTGLQGGQVKWHLGRIRKKIEAYKHDEWTATTDEGGDPP